MSGDYRTRTDYALELERPTEASVVIESREAESKSGALVLAERRSRILKLRRQGFTYDAMAEILLKGEDGGEPIEGINPKTCQRAVATYVRELADQSEEDAEVLRQIDNERLATMFRRLEQDTLSGDEKIKARAIQTQLRILERHAKLNGLDAPTKVDVGVEHRLVADPKHVREVDESFARRHNATIRLPAGDAREVK